MRTSGLIKYSMSFVCGLVLLAVLLAALLAACAPQAAAPTAAGAVETPVSNSSATFNDPFAYCVGVGTIDLPDARYTGPKTPEAVVKGVMKATGAAADMPVDFFNRGTVWRCMDQQVYACFVGANLPCQSKANPSQKPSAEMDDFCKANAGALLIPAAVTGRATIYEWGCKDGKAFAGKQVFQVDGRGYIREIWYAINDGNNP